MASDVLMGNDQDAARWIAPVPGGAAGRRGRRAAGQPPPRRCAGLAAAERLARRPTDGAEAAATADAQVIFTPSGRRGRVPAGTTVLDAARSLGVDIDSVCGGRGICGRCAVTPAFGSFPSTASRPTRRTSATAGEVEAAYRAEHGLAADRRLSCTAQLLGDCVIDVPPESQVHRQVVRKDLDARPFELDPVVRLHTVDVAPPDLATPTGDLGRLFDALRGGVGADRPARRPRGRPGAPAGARRPATTGSRSRSTAAARSSRSGRASTIARSASPSTSARRRSPAISPT